MLETVTGAAISLLNDAGTHVGSAKSQPPVYFDRKRDRYPQVQT